MMHDRELNPQQESPMMMPVDPEWMTTSIRGLPEPIGIQLQGTIKAVSQSERVTAALEGLVTPNLKPQNLSV